MAAPNLDFTGRGFNAAMWTVVASTALLAACLCGSIDTAGWAARFEHPGAEPNLTHQGAMMWRAMLIVLAFVLPMMTWLLQRLGRSAIRHRLSAKPSRQPIADSRSLGRRALWLLVALIVLALLIRMPRLGESLWYDEIASWGTYAAGASSGWVTVGNFLDPFNQPLHALLNRWTVEHLFPRLELELELAFRLPALVFSLLTVPAMFGLVRAAVGSVRGGLLGAALAAVLAVAVLEGAEARAYSMMIFFSAASTWTFIEAWRSRSPGLWLLYAALAALGTWAHFVTAMVAGGHAIWALWFAVRNREWLPAMLALVAIALAGTISITLYAPMLPAMLQARHKLAASTADQPQLLGPEGLHMLLQLGGSWSWWATLPGLGLLGAGGAIAWRSRMTNDELRMTNDASLVSSSFVIRHSSLGISPAGAVELALLGLPVMLTLIVIAGAWTYARFALFALPGAMLLMAMALDALWRRHRAAALGALAIVSIASIADLCIRPPKQPLREAAEYVRSHQQPGDSVLVLDLAHDVLSIYGHDLELHHSYFFGQDLETKLAAIKPAWLIVLYPHHVPKARYDLLRARGYAPTQRLDGWADWGHGDVEVWSK